MARPHHTLALQSNHPLISIIIPTLNEEKDIRHCIQSIYSSTYPKEFLEIIVIDTGSTDQTVKFARDCGARVIELHPKTPSAALGLYIGFQEARGDFIQYLAADSLLDKNWLLTALEEFKKDSSSRPLGVVGGWTRELDPHASLFSHILSIGLRAGEKDIGDVLHNAGSGLISRDVINPTKGCFNPALMSEDEVDFGIKVKRAGFSYRKIPFVMIYHKLGLTNTFYSFRLMLRRYKRQGIGLAQLVSLHRHTPELKLYLKAFRLYIMAGLSPIFFVFISLIAYFFPSIGIALFCLSATAFFIASFMLSFRFHLNYRDTFLLCVWYLLSLWAILIGYVSERLFRSYPLSYSHE